MRRFAAISLIFIIKGCNHIPADPEKSHTTIINDQHLTEKMEEVKNKILELN